jgi:hypothetical protein
MKKRKSYKQSRLTLFLSSPFLNEKKNVKEIHLPVS